MWKPIYRLLRYHTLIFAAPFLAKAIFRWYRALLVRQVLLPALSSNPELPCANGDGCKRHAYYEKKPPPTNKDHLTPGCVYERCRKEVLHPL